MKRKETGALSVMDDIKKNSEVTVMIGNPEFFYFLYKVRWIMPCIESKNLISCVLFQTLKFLPSAVLPSVPAAAFQ